MAYYKFTLKAGVAMSVPVSGRYILVDDLGTAPGIDIMPNYGGRDLPNMPDRKKAFKFAEPYDGLTLRAAVDCTVALFLTASDVSLGLADGSLLNVSGQVTIGNTSASRVPVDLAGGTVTVNAANVGINNTDANPVPVRSAALSTLVHVAPVAINTGAAQGISNDATLKRLRIRNASTNGAVIAIGGAAVTLANAAIVLQPGDVWAEDDAAAAAWYAVSDINGASVCLMGMK